MSGQINQLTIRNEDLHVIPDAISIHGVDAQLNLCVEELGELIVALQKRHRKRGKPLEKKISDIQDELADVFCMVNQTAFIYGLDAVQERVNFKLERAKKRNAENLQ